MKSLLVVAAMLVGSSAWADAGDVTTNVNIDFSNFTGNTGDAAPSSLSGTKGTMYFSNAYQVLDGTNYRLGLRNGANNVSISSSEYAGAKDVVVISFDIAFTQMGSDGKSVYFYLQDKDDSNIAAFTLVTTNSGTYVKSLTNDFGVTVDDIKVTYSASWSDKVSFTITLNYATGKMTTETACTSATNTSSSHTVDMLSSNPVAKFVIGAGYNSNAEKYRCQFDNLLIQTTEGDYASTKTITLAFKDNNNTDISSLYTGQTEFTVDNGSTFTPSNYYPSAMYDDNYKYTYTSGGDPFTVTADAEIILVYTKSTRPTYTYNVTQSYGGKTSKIVDAVVVKEATSYTYYYPRFILDGTTLYEYASSTDPNASASYWTSTNSSVTADGTYTLTYNAVAGECVYFSEGENIEGASEYPYGVFKQYMSNGSAGVLSSASLTSLGAGTYTITARAVGRASDRYIDFYTSSVSDDNKILRVISQNAGSEASNSFVLPTTTTIVGDGGATNNSANGHGCDYVYIMKTADAPTTENIVVSDAGYATYVSNYNLDFTSATTKAYKVNVASKGVATLTEVTKVPAKTPVLLYAEGGNGSGEAIAVTTDAVSAVTGNNLVAGTGAAVTTADGDYTNMILNNVSGNVGFYFAAGQTVASNRAYLHFASSYAPDAAARMTMVFADEATGIESLTPTPSPIREGSIYTLNGQRVAQPTKGLYIVNGKKVIIK